MQKITNQNKNKGDKKKKLSRRRLSKAEVKKEALEIVKTLSGRKSNGSSVKLKTLR